MLLAIVASSAVVRAQGAPAPGPRLMLYRQHEDCEPEPALRRIFSSLMTRSNKTVQQIGAIFAKAGDCGLTNQEIGVTNGWDYVVWSREASRQKVLKLLPRGLRWSALVDPLLRPNESYPREGEAFGSVSSDMYVSFQLAGGEKHPVKIEVEGVEGLGATMRVVVSTDWTGDELEKPGRSALGVRVEVSTGGGMRCHADLRLRPGFLGASAEELG